MTQTNPSENKIRVGVVFGGVSSEKQVSLESGRNLFSKIDRKKYDPLAIFMDSQRALWEIPLKLIMRNSTGDIEVDLAEEATRIPYEALKDRIDLLCIGLHGKYGEDGCLQGLLELLRIPYTGSGVLGSALGSNKYASRRLLMANGIDVPGTVPIDRGDWRGSRRDAILSELEHTIGLPCIVKPNREGCSTAVSKVTAASDLTAALDEAFAWDNQALVEEFIVGVEVTCGVLGNADPVALTPSETIPTSDILSLEDKFLYGQGENKTPARLPEDVLRRIQETAVKAFTTLGLSVYARIDMFVRPNGNVAVLEPNTLPGMTPSTVLFHQAAASGINQTEFIDRILQLSLEAHSLKKGPL
jgi:D-alanine-D-alanine ligase